MMTMLKELAAELIGMFFAEKRLAITVLAIVAAAGSLVDFAGLNPLVGGAVPALRLPHPADRERLVAPPG